MPLSDNQRQKLMGHTNQATFGSRTKSSNPGYCGWRADMPYPKLKFERHPASSHSSFAPLPSKRSVIFWQPYTIEVCKGVHW